jgi:L-lysine exporter family protein LysE/ArgO
MNALSALASGFALSAALIVAIGAQNAFVLRQALRREHVGPVVAFCATSDLVLMSAGVAGLGVLLVHAPRLLVALTLGGVAFLAVYGLAALRRAARPAGLRAAASGGGVSLTGALVRAAGFTFLNPHVYIDTLLLVGSVGAALPPAARPAFVAGAALASALWYLALGYGGRLLAPLLARPQAWRVLDGAIGAVMLGLAAVLAGRLFGTPL